MNVQKSIVEELANDVPKARMTPREFFIAYQGVPTLAYRGFSLGLLRLKDRIQNAVPGIKPENQGSMWPKTTLGALRDGKKLSWDQAFALRKICTAINANVREDGWTLPSNGILIKPGTTFESMESALRRHRRFLATRCRLQSPIQIIQPESRGFWT